MLLPLLPLNFDGLVASCGGYIQFGEQIIYDCPMTEEQKRRVMEVLEKNGVFRTIECMNGSYTDEGFKKFLEDHGSEGGNSELLRWRRQLEESLNIRPMAEYRGEAVYKVVLMAQSFRQLQEPEQVLGEEFQICLQEPDEYGFINGEVVNRKFDKGKAVRRVCDFLGISIENTVGFGDSMNDKEMLEAVGLSICMANGNKQVKELADDVCPPVNEDGLYQGFVKHGLC